MSECDAVRRRAWHSPGGSARSSEWRDGMRAVDAIYTGYGEMRDTCALHGFEPCAAPNETEVYELGAAALVARYPRLDVVRTARALGRLPAEHSDFLHEVSEQKNDVTRYVRNT